MSGLSEESAIRIIASTSQDEASTLASNRTLKVTLLSNEWKSTKGGLSTISRELAIQLAKHPNVEVSVYLPQCSEEDKKIAASLNVNIIEAEELPGYEAVDWLASVPESHAMDCIVGHGVLLGRQIPLIKRHNHHCKWVQIVHTAPEELGMYKTYADGISKGEKKHQAEVKLCEMADQVVAVGPKLADAYSRFLRPCQKDQEVITLTPGIFTEFSKVKQATEERNIFVVLVFGRGDSEDFELKGYDIAAKAIAEMNDMSCHLMFVGAPSGKEEEVKEKLLGYGISPAQLTVHCFDESRGLAKLLCEVDLAIMPSRTEGFGLTALEALSAGLPVLVSGNSGLGEAFKKVATGSNWIVASEDPKDWAKAISAVQEKDRDVRLEECEMLREKYGAKYSWQKQCYSLVETMQKISFAFLELSVETASVKLKRPSSQTGALDSANAKRPKETATMCSAGTNDVAETGVHIPTSGEIFRLIAMRRLHMSPPSTKEDCDRFIEYMSAVNGIVTQDVKVSSLLITVKCRSLLVLEKLWTDYASRHLSEVVQKCLVTEDILNDLGLSELKLCTIIKEIDYKACKQILQESDSSKRLTIHCWMSDEAIGALKEVLSDRSLTSLTLIIYGKMQGSLAAALGAVLVEESILKSLTLIIYGSISYSGAIALERAFLGNSTLNSLKVKMFGELPDNWLTMTENVLEEKKKKMSVAFHPNIPGTISKAPVICFYPGFQLQSLTLNLWGEWSLTGVESICNLLMTSSTPYVTLNVHGEVTNDIADCIVSYLKPCKTLSSLSINIWGELTRDGESALQELACNGKYSVALNVCSGGSDPWICKDLSIGKLDSSSSLTSVFTEVEDTCTRILNLNISNHSLGRDWAYGLGYGLAKNASLTTLSLTLNNYSDKGHGLWVLGLGHGLAKNASLTTLSLTLNNYSDKGHGLWVLGLGHGLAKNASLTTLSLTLNNYSGKGHGYWARGLDHGLAKNASLTTLSLTLNNYSDEGPGDWARGLGYGLAKNASLATLSLTLNNYSDKGPGHWGRGLGYGLKHNASLTTLSLTLNNYSDEGPGDWARGLGYGLAKNASLTTLSLTLNNHSDKGPGHWGRGLGYGLKDNASLTTLSLTLNNYSDEGHGDWTLGLCRGLEGNASLTTLSLTLNNCSGKGHGDWAHGLVYGLEKNASLTTLSLTFNKYSGKEHGYCTRCLDHGLEENASLTTLSLTLNNYGDTGLGCLEYGLGCGLEKNMSLTTLSLTFNNLGEDGARSLGHGLAKNTSLTALSLTFNNDSDRIENWAHSLGDGLSKNTSLTTLSLTFNNYSYLIEDWVHGLGDGLKKNTSLTTLNVTLNNYSDLSRDWACDLGGGVGRSKSLTVVNVTVTTYVKMSEEWLCGLCDSLVESNRISEFLRFTFNDHSGSSEVLGHDLTKHFADCKSSPSLNLAVSLYGEAALG